MAARLLHRARTTTSTTSPLTPTRTPLTTPLSRTAMSLHSARSFSSYFVTPSELSEALKKNSPTKINTLPRTIPLCASWFLPNDSAKRTGIDTFRKQRIPQARFFDLDRVCDKHSDFPHMLPSAKDFARSMSELGIRKDDTIVVYDAAETGIFSAPRVAWTCRVFGHGQVHILNNFKLWVDEGLPTDKGEFFDVNASLYKIPEMNEGRVVEFEEIKQVVQDLNKEHTEGVQILDARPAGRWNGTDAEPREGLSSGHMPGSISLPISALLDPTTKAFLPREELIKVFEKSGVDPARPIIASCGTGVTACVIEAALKETGYAKEGDARVYDGSWTEWAQRVEPAENLIIKSES